MKGLWVMKLVFWKEFPSHHESFFFESLRLNGVDLYVFYFQTLPAVRLNLGWEKKDQLPEKEQFVHDIASIEKILNQTRDYIHIIPTYISSIFIITLLKAIIKHRMSWAILAEHSHPGMRTQVVNSFKCFLGVLINRYGLGALARSILAEKEFLSWGVSHSKIAVFPYTVPAVAENGPIDEVCQKFCNGRMAFVFLGSLNKRKAVDILLRASANIKDIFREKGWVLLLVGNDTSNGHYKKLSDKLGVSDACLFRGPVSPQNVPNQIRAAHVLILPSRHDGWGVVVNEAASAGKAIIISEKVGAAYHLLENGYNGFRIKAGDSHSLEKAMLSYMFNPDLALTHGENSKSIFNNFTPELYAMKLISILRSFQSLKYTFTQKGRGLGF
jgi:glycosyltransferase involved in cell wall biosynthesis